MTNKIQTLENKLKLQTEWNNELQSSYLTSVSSNPKKRRSNSNSCNYNKNNHNVKNNYEYNKIKSKSQKHHIIEDLDLFIIINMIIVNKD